MSRKKTTWGNLFFVATVALIVSAVLWGRHAFRVETVDNPKLGIMSYHYQWGRRSWLLADTNRDGQVDVRTRLGENGSSPVELWEDRDGNGVFEVHLFMKGDSISMVEFDEDQDGYYETRRTGVGVSSLWSRIISEEGALSEE